MFWAHECSSSPASCHLVQIVRRIDVAVRSVKWSDNGDLVAILGETSFYVLQHDREVRCRRSLAVLCTPRVWRPARALLQGCLL
jgi:Coatomer WD associated region